jgi:predicted 3-demethylubiquinone-9 3-methyltransferase (glyoxalase superfamily)
MSAKQKIVPFLWFDDDAEEAIRFYSAIFPDSRVLGETRQGPKGPLISARFQLAGREFMALNGGPMYSFTEAISLFVSCENQAEVDELWAKLTAGGGEPGRCGWLKDKYGLSWQVIPTALGEMLYDKDPAKAKRVAEAMLKMGKIDIARLRQAYEGR